ncbi:MULTISPECIES: restriction endonuclease [unclassified Paenibacillus]|uniref:restriction endonuclease n=1 Tax=unclassified Paenibacillus TaxID=185978 RepID=UPI000CFCF3D8|nr:MULTISPECIES: restriction endonuclease [unclassified Paenibacillus]PRA08668.1 hypothetical protein CQ043_01410 [Paenibacillus sp. MYb63]PRA48601.1 hypothetical protein CQ061_09865 [Paenibacillus sp. MYb67]
MSSYQKGKEFEEFIHYVYSNLIKLNDSKARISKRTTLVGRSNSTSEFDIYYEFQHLNILHKVAIECKNHVNPVSVKEVRDFVYKVNDVGNVVGVMISKAGYQEGAKNVAHHDHIKLMTINDLPSFSQIVGMKISKLFLPDHDVIGAPFWIIMEKFEDFEVNGNYMTFPNNSEYNYKFLIPLFFSKVVAEKFNEVSFEGSGVVRGVNQMQLYALYNFSKLHNFGFIELLLEPEENRQALSFILHPEELKRKYYLGED